MVVTVGNDSFALTRVEGVYSLLDNRCPHQGGPLGEGTIEGCLLRCPWHGYDYDARTGISPGGFGDGVACYPVELRDDGVYAELPGDRPHLRTTSDVVAATLVAWGVDTVFGMVGHSNLGHGRRASPAGAVRGAPVLRHPPRGSGRVRGKRLRQAHRAPRSVPEHRGARRDEPAHRPVGREGRPRARRRTDGPGGDERHRRPQLPGARPARGLRPRRGVVAHDAARLRPRRADVARRQACTAHARRLASRAPRRGAEPPVRRARGVSGRTRSRSGDRATVRGAGRRRRRSCRRRSVP